MPNFECLWLDFGTMLPSNAIKDEPKAECAGVEAYRATELKNVKI